VLLIHADANINEVVFLTKSKEFFFCAIPRYSFLRRDLRSRSSLLLRAFAGGALSSARRRARLKEQLGAPFLTSYVFIPLPDGVLNTILPFYIVFRTKYYFVELA
jgi:hypothetical protein